MKEAVQIRLVNQAVLNSRSRHRTADLVVVPHQSRGRNVAALSRVNAVHVANTLTMFRLLTVGDVNSVLVDDGRADDLVAGFRPFRVFRVGIKLPELLAGQGLIS